MIDIRFAEAHDASAIARLHADSWRHHYRGAYSAFYLDGDLDGERLSVWTTRLEHIPPNEFTLAAQSSEGLIGFAHVLLDVDPMWGALVENLHVARSLHRNGLGTRLLAAAAEVTIERRPTSAMHLWVLEQNVNGQAFYRARGGEIGQPEPIDPPGGDPRNMEGNPCKLLVTWADPTVLMQR